MSAPFHVDNTYVFYYNHLCLVQVKGVIEAVENACLPPALLLFVCNQILHESRDTI